MLRKWYKLFTDKWLGGIFYLESIYILDNKGVNCGLKNLVFSELGSDRKFKRF
jgi:hypothetical protein